MADHDLFGIDWNHDGDVTMSDWAITDWAINDVFKEEEAEIKRNEQARKAGQHATGTFIPSVDNSQIGSHKRDAFELFEDKPRRSHRHNSYTDSEYSEDSSEARLDAAFSLLLDDYTTDEYDDEIDDDFIGDDF